MYNTQFRENQYKVIKKIFQVQFSFISNTNDFKYYFYARTLQFLQKQLQLITRH